MSPAGHREELRPTGLHKFYSETRGDWVSAKEVHDNEVIRGRAGPLAIVDSRQLPGTQRVYNLTVEGEHVYYVSELGLLAHNNGCAVQNTHGTIGKKWYHGTDIDSANDIVNNGLDRGKLLSSDPVEGSSTPGFFVTDKLSDAQDYARIRAGERGTTWQVIEIDDADIGHLLQGAGTKLDEAVIPFNAFDQVPPKAFSFRGTGG